MRHVKWPSGPSCETERAALDRTHGEALGMRGATRVALNSGQNAVQSNPGIAEMTVTRSARRLFKITLAALRRVRTTSRVHSRPGCRRSLHQCSQLSRPVSRAPWRPLGPSAYSLYMRRCGAGAHRSATAGWTVGCPGRGVLSAARVTLRTAVTPPDEALPDRPAGWSKTHGCGRRGGMLGTGGSTRR